MRWAILLLLTSACSAEVVEVRSSRQALFKTVKPSQTFGSNIFASSEPQSDHYTYSGTGTYSRSNQPTSDPHNSTARDAATYASVWTYMLTHNL